MKRIIILTLGLFLTVPAFSQDIKGSWGGLLNVNGSKLPIVFNISEKDGGYSATMDSPSQGAKGIPVSVVNFENGKLTLSVAGVGIEYEGVWQPDLIIVGTFKQNGYSLPLNLTPTKNAPIVRPQDPKPPYPYRSEDVKFENKSAGITLAGTLTLPKESKNFPVAILVTGSGPENRNEEVFDHRPFLILSDYLTRNGIAVLRYDNRGVGESSGKFESATLDDLASDATAAISYLKTRKEINPKKIGVIGHSQGGTIAVLLAGEKNSNLAYIVSMAGAAIPGDSLLRMQRYLLSKAMGVSDAQIDLNEEVIALTNDIISKNPKDSILQNPDKFINDVLQILPDSLKEYKAVKAQIQQGFKELMSPAWRSIMNCNPSEALTKIKCPVLALNGEKDLQVPPDVNLDRIKALVKSPVTVKKYPALNHLFQHCTTGLPAEYGNIDETMSPEVLSDIAAWIKQVTR